MKSDIQEVKDLTEKQLGYIVANQQQSEKSQGKMNESNGKKLEEIEEKSQRNQEQLIQSISHELTRLREEIRKGVEERNVLAQMVEYTRKEDRKEMEELIEKSKDQIKSNCKQQEQARDQLVKRVTMIETHGKDQEIKLEQHRRQAEEKHQKSRDEITK